jgi:hypothetical protein
LTGRTPAVQLELLAIRTIAEPAVKQTQLSSLVQPMAIVAVEYSLAVNDFGDLHDELFELIAVTAAAGLSV